MSNSHYDLGLHYTSSPHSGFERVRVDAAQTSFFEGREFRTFKELDVAAGATYVLKVVTPVDLILNSLEVFIDGGEIRVGTYVGGTEGGTFSETLPIIPANRMASRRTGYGGVGGYYDPQVVITAGGTHTGGTELDVIRLNSSSGGQAASVGSAPFDERGVSAGTYYFRLTNAGGQSTTGTFKARWEERVFL